MKGDVTLVKITVNALKFRTLLLQFSNGPRHEKFCLQWFANNTGADQPAHRLSLISAFVIHSLESVISKLATHEISIS